MLQLMFNPGLTFIGFRTTRPWYVLGVKTPFSSADSALDQFFKTISGDLVSCEAQLPAAVPERSPRSSGHEWAAELSWQREQSCPCAFQTEISSVLPLLFHNE